MRGQRGRRKAPLTTRLAGVGSNLRTQRRMRFWDRALLCPTALLMSFNRSRGASTHSCPVIWTDPELSAVPFHELAWGQEFLRVFSGRWRLAAKPRQDWLERWAR
jgi:hypothetical protein